MSIAPMQVLNRNEKYPSNLRQPNEKWLSVPIGSGNTLTLTNLQVEIGTLLKKNLNLPKYFTACMMPRTGNPKPRRPQPPDSPAHSPQNTSGPAPLKREYGAAKYTNQALKRSVKRGRAKTRKCGNIGTSSSQYDHEMSEPSAQKHYPQTPSTHHGETPTQSDGRTESQTKHH